jgi:predicted  nucleic acid-binding Zn-ribbon protein
MTPQEETELKARILKLEEEKDSLLKSIETRHPKADAEKSLSEIKGELSDLRGKLSEAVKRIPASDRGPDKDDPDTESPLFF